MTRHGTRPIKQYERSLRREERALRHDARHELRHGHVGAAVADLQAANRMHARADAVHHARRSGAEPNCLPVDNSRVLLCDPDRSLASFTGHYVHHHHPHRHYGPPPGAAVAAGFAAGAAVATAGQPKVVYTEPPPVVVAQPMVHEVFFLMNTLHCAALGMWLQYRLLTSLLLASATCQTVYTGERYCGIRSCLVFPCFPCVICCPIDRRVGVTELLLPQP
eukprot:scaffold7599_cov417-Prasinococcus_capsulatus_cf.AAC.4